MSEMSVPRGRFSVTAVSGQVYAVGGSNGFHEQKAMETYDLQENKWVVKGSVDTAKVSQGITFPFSYLLLFQVYAKLWNIYDYKCWNFFMKGPPGASSNRIVRLSIRLFVCPPLP